MRRGEQSEADLSEQTGRQRGDEKRMSWGERKRKGSSREWGKERKKRRAIKWDTVGTENDGEERQNTDVPHSVLSLL